MRILIAISLMVLAQLATAKNAHATCYGLYCPPTPINNTYVTNNYEVEDKNVPNRFGAKLDAPYLVKLSDNWFIGTEGGKDLWSTNFDEAWFVYGKITYTGTLINLKK